MSWVAYLGDTMTGQISQQIDVPNFSWSITVSDTTFTTTRDKSVEDDSGHGVTLPWGAVPADDPSERASMLMPIKRCLSLMWIGDDDVVHPIIWGAIGPRTDSWEDTSFDIMSAMSILENRFVINENVFGAVNGYTKVQEYDDWKQPDNDDRGYSEGAHVKHNGRVWESKVDGNKQEPGKGDSWEDQGDVPVPQPATFTRNAIYYGGMSLRGIASEVGRLCTDYKPAGQLPIDWTYLGEKGKHERTYDGFDVGNNSCADVLDKITNVLSGPDMQFRPYLADNQHVRLRFLAGSDSDIYLGQSVVHSLSCFPGGGSLQDVQVDFGYPTERVYGTGSGTDEAQLCHLSQDLSLCQMRDPWPLLEVHYNDSDGDSAALIKDHTDAELSASSWPAMQLRGTVDFADPDVPAPGSIWPGETVDVSLTGFPTIPDGVYEMRLMSMSGDQTTKATLDFKAIANPIV